MQLEVAQMSHPVQIEVHLKIQRRQGLHHIHGLKAAVARRIQTRLLDRSAILNRHRRQIQVLSAESLLSMLGAQHLD